MKKFRRQISILVVILVFLSGISVTFAKPVDYSENWANKEISEWLSLGIAQTDSKGDFRPNEPIKRIDVAILLNRLLNYQEKSTLKFSDIPDTSPFAADAAKAAAAGIFTGDNGKFRPDDKITRQEAAVVFARAFNLNTADNKSLSKFKDAGKVALWSRASVGAMAEKGYMSGKSGGLFAPASDLTRAEAVKIVDNIVKELKNKAGTYTGDINGNLVVNTRKVILENMTIRGDLYLTEGIGSGEVTLNNVSVTGRTIIKGGGENSIVLNNTSVGGSLIVIKKDGKIRIAASGKSEIADTVLNSGAKLEESNLTGNGFGNVEIIRMEPGQQVTLDGDFASLSIETDGVKAVIPDGAVKTIKIKQGTNGSKLDVGETASVGELVANDDITVSGGSRIEKAYINSNGVVLDTKPGAVDIANGINASVGGTDMTSRDIPAAPPAPPAAPPTTPPASGGGGSGRDDNDGPPTTQKIVITAGNKTITVGSTTSSAITVNPSDAVLSYSSSKPSVASVDPLTGIIKGISTGSATITVTASKSGYIGKTVTFSVDVVEDTIHPTVKATISGNNIITLTFSKPVKQTGGEMIIYESDGVTQLSSVIWLEEFSGFVKWDSPTVVNVYGNMIYGLSETDAKEIKLKISGIVDTTPNANTLEETVLTLMAADNRAPVIVTVYLATADGTADEDTIRFGFSEPMDMDTVANPGNYEITAPGGVYITGKKLSDYKAFVLVSSISADKKSITFRIKDGKAASYDGLAFKLSGMKDLAGNLANDTDVIPAAADFYVTDVSIVDDNKLSIEFNQDIGNCYPGAFVLKEGAAATSATAANILSIEIDSKNYSKLYAKIAAPDNRVLTNLDGMYLHVRDCSLARDVYEQEMTASVGPFASGPITIPDKAKAVVGSITGTFGGIIIQFSELVTTTATGFLSEILITRDGERVTIDPSAISAIDGNLSTGFTKLLVSVPNSGATYKVQIYASWSTLDKSGNRVKDVSDPIIVKTIDNEAPQIESQYKAADGSAASMDDQFTFHFSEAMDADTVEDLHNYMITTPGGAFYTGKTLYDYKDTVSVRIFDKDTIVFDVKDGYKAACDGLSFRLSGMKDEVGNLCSDTDVTPILAGFYVTAVKGVGLNTIEIDFSEDVGSCSPSAFAIRDGVSSTTPAYAYFEFMEGKDGNKVFARITRYDSNGNERFLTDFSGLYLHILDSGLVKDEYTGEMITSIGAFVNGPVAIPDEAKAEVKSITAADDGIIIEFSESVTTTAAGFLSELLITRDGSKVTVSPSSISAIDGSLSTGFTRLLISGLTSNMTYKVQIYANGSTLDKSGNYINNVTVPVEVRAG